MAAPRWLPLLPRLVASAALVLGLVAVNVILTGTDVNWWTFLGAMAVSGMLLSPAVLIWIGASSKVRVYGSRGRVERLSARLKQATVPVGPGPKEHEPGEDRGASDGTPAPRRFKVRVLAWELLLWSGAVLFNYAIVVRAMAIAGGAKGSIVAGILIAFSPLPILFLIFRHRDDDRRRSSRWGRAKARLRSRMARAGQRP